jgi:hypothetical protein
LSYRHKYCPLGEAVQLVADRLAVADLAKYAHAAAAVEDAKKQLLAALFEGAVRAEGVRCYPADPPAYEPPSVEYDKWHPIDRGVWSFERYEHLIESHRLDTICVFWNEDYIEYFNNDGEWAEYIDWKIRLVCADLDQEFPAMNLAESGVPQNAHAKQTYMTGLPGRPSPTYLAKQEMHRRAKEGILCSELAAEMRELCRWLEREHSDAPPVKPKSLGNALREEYRRLKRSLGSS